MLGQKYIQRRELNSVGKELRKSTMEFGSNTCAVALLHQKLKYTLDLKISTLSFFPSISFSPYNPPYYRWNCLPE